MLYPTKRTMVFERQEKYQEEKVGKKDYRSCIEYDAVDGVVSV